MKGSSQSSNSVNAKYPFTKTEVKMFSLATGQVNFTWDNIFQGLRTNRVIIGFLSVAGSYTLNPWNFKHYDISQLALSIYGTAAGGNAIKTRFDTHTLE